MSTQSGRVKRINVAVTTDTVAALERVMEREGVSLTEAVRRLVTYGNFVYSAARINDALVIIQAPDGSQREVIIL